MSRARPEAARVEGHRGNRRSRSNRRVRRDVRPYRELERRVHDRVVHAVAAGSDPRSWLDAQIAEYERLLPAYRWLGDLLDQLLRESAARHAPLAIVQTRTKSVASFAEKCLRKRHKYAMPAHQLTDLCGCRVVVRTLGELHQMSAAIEAAFNVDWENSLDVSRRLHSAEFGYRSVHYVVTVPSDMELGDGAPKALRGFDCATCGSHHQLKAEIQVRTTVQHAWADFAHDLTYKGAFPLPEHIKRAIAVIAAELEDVDQSFARIEHELRTYVASYGSYLSDDDLRRERELLDAARAHSTDNAGLALRSAKLSMRLGDWGTAVDVLEPFESRAEAGRADAAAVAPVLRDLGVSLCKLHRDRRIGEQYRRGQALIERAIELAPDDRDALASLAGTWKGVDDDRAHALYLRAVELDPADYYPLGNLLDYELARRGPVVLPVVRPLLAAAMERCRAHSRLGINVPWALFDQGRFHLLSDEPYESVHAYALALSASSSAFMVDSALASLERIAEAAQHLEGFEWVRRLLVVGRAGRFPSDESFAAVQPLASPSASDIRGPVVIVAGGAASSVEARLRDYLPLLVQGFDGFAGTAISGGTEQGVSGLIAAVREKVGRTFRLIGYLPHRLPSDATADQRYDELRYTDGERFSPLEPVQNWIDLIASGVDPADVRVLGINGGPIAAVEYRIAAALGAVVGLVEESGREAARLLADAAWMTTSNRIVPLPPDPEIIRAFISPRPSGFPDDVIDVVAMAAHDVYVREAAIERTADPSRRPWDDLPASLRRSTRARARNMTQVLALAGCVIKPAAADESASPMAFTDDEVERMAVAEHARWTVERLLDGWRWGPARDVEAKTSPYLIAWDQLTDDVREIDRVLVRRIPDVLAQAGLVVRRESLRRALPDG